jgi:hypothetical protein
MVQASGSAPRDRGPSATREPETAMRATHDTLKQRERLRRARPLGTREALARGGRGRVVTTVRRDLCSREKMSTDASKARADVARGTGVKMQGLSAIAEAMLYCTQASFFSSVVTCELQPFLERRCFWSTAESMRGILNSWLGGAAIALYRCDWWCR